MGKVSTADTETTASDVSSVGCSGTQRATRTPSLLQCPHMTGEMTAHVSITRSMWFRAALFLLSFLPPFFVVR